MDFAEVLGKLVDNFEVHKVRYAIIGGVALGFLGQARATLDVDFLVHRDDLASLERLMTKLGYKKVFSTDNVSQYEHTDIKANRIDFIHAFREISLSMLSRAQNITIPKNRTVRVAAPEDVIGLKVQSIANDPSRKSRDMADIEALMDRHGKKLDWQILSQYFILFDMKDVFDVLKRRFCDAH